MNNKFIFHRQDWGAIVLIDERFNKSPRYTNGKELLYLNPNVPNAVFDRISTLKAININCLAKIWNENEKQKAGHV